MILLPPLSKKKAGRGLFKRRCMCLLLNVSQVVIQKDFMDPRGEIRSNSISFSKSLQGVLVGGSAAASALTETLSVLAAFPMTMKLHKLDLRY